MASAADWIDSEITDMWSGQKPDGIIEGWHGDGNSARTAIMYALWKTQGLTVQPWRDDRAFRCVREGDTLYVSIIAEQAFQGKLLFDKQRHKRQMHLPMDYPRINQFPEWFTTDAEQTIMLSVKPPTTRPQRLPGNNCKQGCHWTCSRAWNCVWSLHQNPSRRKCRATVAAARSRIQGCSGGERPGLACSFTGDP